MHDAADIRERLGKCIAVLGSEHAGERQAGLDAVTKTLGAAGLSWNDLAAMIGQPREPDRERLLTSLVGERVRSAMSASFGIKGEEAGILKQIGDACTGAGVSGISTESLTCAIGIANAVRGRTGR
jgi:hypothetical protein